MPNHRFLSARTSALLIAALALGPLTLVAGPAVGTPPGSRASSGSAEVARTWQRIALRTVYDEAKTPIPSGTLYLGFTSLAVDDAVQTSLRRHQVSARSAAATAAHDVLEEYFPASEVRLDADLAATLAAVPAGRAKDRGVRIGREAAAEMIASRTHDGRDNAAITYRRDARPGVWQPQPPAAGMLVPWLGFVDFLELGRPVRLDGPDPITSRRYAAEFDEVRRLGSATSTERTAEQTTTARFFNSNAAILYRDALLRHLDTADLSLARTTRLFAAVDAATADTMIQCWRVKYRYGYWRPSQAIRLADTDGNPRTAPDRTWAPLLPEPPYGDYVSGHGCVTSSFAGAVRPFLGDDVPLRLRSVATGTERLYPTLTAVERAALESRIWAGLHFRDAMDDAYRLGHSTARRVVAQVDRHPRQHRHAPQPAGGR